MPWLKPKKNPATNNNNREILDLLNQLCEAQVKMAAALMELQDYEKRERFERLTRSSEAKGHFKLFQKSEYLNAERRLDYRLNALINVQAELYRLTYDADPQEKTLSWEEVNEVIRGELFNLIRDPIPGLPNNPPHRPEPKEPKDVSETPH